MSTKGELAALRELWKRKKVYLKKEISLKDLKKRAKKNLKILGEEEIWGKRLSGGASRETSG